MIRNAHTSGRESTTHPSFPGQNTRKYRLHIQHLASLILVCQQFNEETCKLLFFGKLHAFGTISGLCHLPRFLNILQHMKQYGWKRLTQIELQRSHGRFRPCSRMTYRQLYDLLRGCVKLETLKLTLHLEQALVRASAAPETPYCTMYSNSGAKRSRCLLVRISGQ